MKLFLLLLVFPFVVKAAPQKPPHNVEDYRWLYETLFAEADRVTQPNESFKSFYVHLLDTDQKFPAPEHIEEKNLQLVEKITGAITYVNIIQKKYAYDILKSENKTLILNVRVHLKDPMGSDVNNFTEKLKLAESIWNGSRVLLDFNYAFKFELVRTEAEAHFSVAVLDSTRGPYDRNWGRNWSPVTIAHELGHMLGLGDEYQTLSGNIDCLKASLMCASSTGRLMQHHYYFILRRLVNTRVLF